MGQRRIPNLYTKTFEHKGRCMKLWESYLWIWHLSLERVHLELWRTNVLHAGSTKEWRPPTLSPSSPGEPAGPAGPGRPTGPCTPSLPAGPWGPFSPCIENPADRYCVGWHPSLSRLPQLEGAALTHTLPSTFDNEITSWSQEQKLFCKWGCKNIPTFPYDQESFPWKPFMNLRL